MVTEMIYPPKLEKGDVVGLVCPSSPVSRKRETACVQFLEELGYKVKCADNLHENYAGYMAGNGRVRGEWINRMFADREVKAILCVRGGDGGSRAMEYLDPEVIRSNPKIFVGYSDITSIHLFLNQSCRLVTFGGPMVSSNMVDSFDEETARSFFQAINAEEDYFFQNPEGHHIRQLKSGKSVRGQLTGGNLAVMTAGIGTPYEVDTDGKILFIEEIGETMPRIDRMMYQLRNSGKLHAAKGIILGQFTKCVNENNSGYNELNIIEDALSDIDIPVVYNVQSGHEKPMMTLAFGAECTLDAEDCSIKFHIDR